MRDTWLLSPYKETPNTSPVILTTYANPYFRQWTPMSNPKERKMIRNIVKLPAIACGIAAWTVIISGLYAQYVYRETRACYKKRKYNK